MEFEGPLDPNDPRSARRLRSAQRIINQGQEANIGEEQEATGNAEDTTVNDEISQLREKQNVILEQLKNLSDAIFQISSTQTNVASIRIEQVSEVYFARQVRPLLDALYFISISSLNIAGVAQALQNNTFGERKELRKALELVYSMNEEIDDIIDALRRRMKIYLLRLREMDKSCPPFVHVEEEDS